MSNKSKFADAGYDVHITGRHVLVTDAMKNYAIEKISKIEKFSDRIIDVQVMMDIQKVDHRVDIRMQIGHFHIKSHSTTTDMYASIDEAVRKIERQLMRYKTKLQSHHGQSLEEVDMQVNVIKSPTEEELNTINDAIQEESMRQMEKDFGIHQIVAQETLPLKSLRIEEATMKMDLSGDTFLLFREEESHKLKLIYRRNDGNYGLINPEG